MKFRYFLGFSVSLELTLGDYCLEQANSSSLFFYFVNAIKQDIHKTNEKSKNSTFYSQIHRRDLFLICDVNLLFLFAIQCSYALIQLSILKYSNPLGSGVGSQNFRGAAKFRRLVPVVEVWRHRTHNRNCANKMHHVW